MFLAPAVSLVPSVVRGRLGKLTGGEEVSADRLVGQQRVRSFLPFLVRPGQPAGVLAQVLLPGRVVPEQDEDVRVGSIAARNSASCSGGTW